MKPIFQKLAPSPSQSIFFINEQIPHFTVPWHFHPEIEILYINKSSGKSYVGDSINSFSKGDLFIVGENVPHWWKSHESYMKVRSAINTEALIIQFKKNCFGSVFCNLPEMSKITGFLERTSRGLRFYGNSLEKLGKQVKKIFRLSGVKRITELIMLLDNMANTNEYKYLSSVGYSDIVNKFDFHRFNKIHEFIISNYTSEIKLEDVAEAAHMCPTAFCRYFKKCTGKTFFTFLTEFKIGNACKLLQEENMTVARACIESGFQNLSHFNKQFKKIIGLTPSEYRKEYSKGVK